MTATFTVQLLVTPKQQKKEKKGNGERRNWKLNNTIEMKSCKRVESFDETPKIHAIVERCIWGIQERKYCCSLEMISVF